MYFLLYKRIYNNNTMDNTLNILYQTLYSDRVLKDLQLEIIKNLIIGNDVIAILATGFGKSICYQLPMLYFKKNVIVISPLIALMEDQQHNLNKLNIQSVCLNSSLTNTVKSYEKMKIYSNSDGIIIYFTPETFIKEEIFIKNLIKNDNLCLIAIDESHCISTWGSDFRKDYQKLSCIKKWLLDINIKIPIFACTATATAEVQNEIIKYLNITNPIIIKSSFDRKNLYIKCNKKSDIRNDLAFILEDYNDKYVIIYAKTRDDTTKICETLNEIGVNAKIYNGGMTMQERKIIQNEFIEGKFKCMVATLAFGMGIDQNINLVVHYGLPSDIDSYVQEIGRAGRDGNDANCIMFWSDTDINTCTILLSDLPLERRKHKENQLRYINKLVRTDECRKKIILRYFGEKIDKCMRCDNCDKNIEIKYDQQKIHLPIYMIFSVIFSCNKNSLGITKIIDIIRGSKNKSAIEFNTLVAYNTCAKYNSILLKDIIKLLIYNNYLREIYYKFGSTVAKSYKSSDFWSKYSEIDNIELIDWPTLIIPQSFEILCNYLK